MALTFAGYVFKPFFPSCQVPDSSVRLLAAATICKSVLHLFYCISYKTIYSTYSSCSWKLSDIGNV